MEVTRERSGRGGGGLKGRQRLVLENMSSTTHLARDVSYCGWPRSGYGRVQQCGSGDWKRV